MSRYDNLQYVLNKIRRMQITATVLPAGVVAAIGAIISLKYSTGLVAFLVFMIVLVVLPFSLNYLWASVSVGYADSISEGRRIEGEMRSLKLAVDGIYSRYPRRQKGEQFKQAYNLHGKSVADLEKTLAIGMYFEEKEVFVTAFITDGIAVRVTASIGSAFRCSASDDPSRWREHITRLRCQEIRQYHNHPTHNNHTEPSATDYRSCQKVKLVLKEHADKLRSFILHWNQIREWRIIEYDQSEKYWLTTAFDVSV